MQIGRNLKTVRLADGMIFCGYEDGDIIGHMEKDRDYCEKELLDKWILPRKHVLKVIYDIGAGIGSYSVYFAAHTDAKRVIALEASADNYELLRRNISRNGLSQVEIVHIGSSGPQSSADPIGTGKTAENEEEEALAWTASLNELRLPAPDFVRIDAKGQELHVLKGMREILSNSMPDLWIKVRCEDAAAVCEWLGDIGYGIADYELQRGGNVLFFHQSKGEERCRGKIFQELFAETIKRRYLDGLLNKTQFQLEEMTGKFTQADQKLKMYEISKLFRLMKLIWTISTKFRFYRRKWLYRAAGWTYRKLMPYPGLIRLCSRVNRKLKIVKDPQQMLRETAKSYSKAGGSPDNSSSLKKASELKVAAVVDEFTYNSFKFECHMLPVEPNNWKDIFEKNRIDLFFCESAWCGADTKRSPWKGRVYGSCNFSKENRNDLLEILEYCRKNHISTVFWNKEDPTHYEDKVHNFVDTAIKFDHIFTTDAACVERYRKDYGHKSVHCLAFATQPKLFNPIETRKRTEEIIFAGSWYRQHKERSREMEAILDNILRQGYTLKIYDRHSGTSDPNHIFPERFQKYLHPALRHDELDDAYKGSRYALNINTVVESDTMFARRVFELMSSNTFVLSNYSKGIEELFGDNVLFVDGEKPICLEKAEEKAENCLYEVLRNHTYRIRWQSILQCIQYPYQEDSRKVCFFYQVHDFSAAEKTIRHFETVTLSEKCAVLIADKDMDSRELQWLLEQYQGSQIRVVSERYCREYEDVLLLNSPYFIFADESLQADFAEKALLHDTYLAGKAGIVKGEPRYTFKEYSGYRNMFCPAGMFEDIKQELYIGNSEKRMVYMI